MIKFALPLIIASLVLTPTTATADTTDSAAADRPGQWARTSGEVLSSWYNPNTGIYDTTNWWNAANALNAEIDLSRLQRTRTGPEHAATTYAKFGPEGFYNHYYDDEGWWALAWINAYDLTRDQRYLVVAKNLFTDMAAGWDTVCGGGIWWNKEKTYKNAIPNELFISTAARLAQRARGSEARHYRDWAQRGWTWFAGTGMINSSNLVNDGLDAQCANNGRPTWTYNQGVILGALTDLADITHDRRHVDTAHRIATAAVRTVVYPNGILREPCEADNGCGADGPQFKGIFMRNLAYLHTESPRRQYADFIRANAKSIWHNNRDAGNRLGLKWVGPFDTADAARQSSAQDALNAAAAL
nr:glycoside hydrolase family 76 protein [Kibdelosporangium sp. MJ126-NF4]CEL21459.1 glycosyl hydrolase [Kibdelosporangium sp. MJ126-NF4]CTQ95974.1 glycosyl hydrolase [Kibdelosporangium sp. MJ126-NF4]